MDSNNSVLPQSISVVSMNSLVGHDSIKETTNAKSIEGKSLRIMEGARECGNSKDDEFSRNLDLIITNSGVSLENCKRKLSTEGANLRNGDNSRSCTITKETTLITIDNFLDYQNTNKVIKTEENAETNVDNTTVDQSAREITRLENSTLGSNINYVDHGHKDIECNENVSLISNRPTSGFTVQEYREILLNGTANSSSVDRGNSSETIRNTCTSGTADNTKNMDLKDTKETLCNSSTNSISENFSSNVPQSNAEIAKRKNIQAVIYPKNLNSLIDTSKSLALSEEKKSERAENVPFISNDPKGPVNLLDTPQIFGPGIIGQGGITSVSDTTGNSSYNENSVKACNDLIENLTKKSNRKYGCVLCGKRFHSKANLMRHEVVHSGKKNFPCGICGKEFSREYNLTTHRRIHTEEKNFKCDLCGKGFYWKSCLSRHMGVHTDEKDFTCPICGKVFFNKSYVTGHMVVHTGEKKFKCEICGKGFSFKVSLRKHRVMHTNEKHFKCDICGKEFFQKSNLNLHRVVHTSKKNFECDLCGKVFSSKTYLGDHIALHTGEFKCEVCGKNFSRSASLIRHKAVHTVGREVFKCDLCNKTFNKKSNLILHKVVHTGQKDFTCEVCGRSYFHKFNLIQHMAIHTGDIKCNICGKTFGRQSRLTQHMATHADVMNRQAGEIFPAVPSDSASATSTIPSFEPCYSQVGNTLLTGKMINNTLFGVAEKNNVELMKNSALAGMVGNSAIMGLATHSIFSGETPVVNVKVENVEEGQTIFLRDEGHHRMESDSENCAGGSSSLESHPQVLGPSEPLASVDHTNTDFLSESVAARTSVSEPKSFPFEPGSLSRGGSNDVNRIPINNIKFEVADVYIKEECDV